MEDYFSRFLSLGLQLRQYLTELIENLLGYIDWIPQRLEIQFSASRGGSLPVTTGCNHEGAYGLSAINTTTEKQTANGIYEGTIFRKRFSSIYQRYSFLIASSVRKLFQMNLTLTFFWVLCHIHFATICVIRSYGRSSYLLHGFRLVQRLAFRVRDQWCLFSSGVHAKLTRILHRFWTTLHGSCEDIGWLQRTRTSLCSIDGTGRFKEILHEIRNGLHCLPNTLVYLFIPGLFSNHSPLYFTNTKRFFSKMGLACHIAKIHSEASVEKNAWELKQYIEELYWGSGKQVLLLGHSKGGVDAAAALSLYWSELKGKVAGLALVQSPYGGTPIASDILREGQIADKETRRIMEFIVCKLIKGDMRALEDLTYAKRKDFISKHKLPIDELPIISFHTEASTAPTVLATLTRVTQAELLPWLPLPRFFLSASEFIESMLASLKVPVVAPVSAAMAFTALHLRLRYGERSDGLVTRRDAEVPGSVVVRPERRLDHAWMVYSSLKKGSAEADASEMCEALLAMLVEISRKKKFC